MCCTTRPAHTTQLKKAAAAKAAASAGSHSEELHKAAGNKSH